MELPPFWSDLSDYLSSKFGEGVGMSVGLLWVPFLFCWSRTLSVGSGILAGIAGPAALIYMGNVPGDAVGHAILLTITVPSGALFGFIAHGTYRRMKQEREAKSGRWRSAWK